MRKIWTVMMVLAIVGWCSGCGMQETSAQRLLQYQEREESYRSDTTEPDWIPTMADDAGVSDITEDVMTEYFHDLYGMVTLTGQHLYWDGTRLQMEYEFPNTASRSEIDAARSFALQKFVLGLGSKGNMSPYEFWRQKERLSGADSLSEVVCNIMIDGELLIQDRYHSGQLERSYENRTQYLPARAVTPDGVEPFVDFLGKQLKDPNVSFQKSLTESALFVTLEVEEVPSLKKLERVEAYIQDTFSKENPAYPGIDFSILQDGQQIFRAVYFNRAEDGAWVGQDWLDCAAIDTDAAASMYITDAVEGEITVKVVCKDNLPHTFGESYAIEWFYDGSWHAIPYRVADEGSFAFPSIGYPVSDAQGRDWSTTYEGFYGKLPVGKYRIVKDIFRDDIRPIEKQYLAAEFYINQDSITY